jgi:hypothetical protein
MSSNETFNEDCLSCVGKGRFWVPPVEGIPAAMRCPLRLGDTGTCVGKRTDIKCLPSQVDSVEGCEQRQACNSFADIVYRCSVTVCRLEGKEPCNEVAIEVWLPVVCAILWLVNMIIVWKFLSARGQKPFPKYVALCFFFGPLVWPYVLYVTRMSTSSNQEAKIEELANGQTQPHGQALEPRDQLPPYGQPTFTTYGQVLQPAPYGQPTFTPYGQVLQPAPEGLTVPYGQPQPYVQPPPYGQSAPQGQPNKPASFFDNFEVVSHSGFKNSGRVA